VYFHKGSAKKERRNSFHLSKVPLPVLRGENSEVECGNPRRRKEREVTLTLDQFRAWQKRQWHVLEGGDLLSLSQGGNLRGKKE